MKKIIAIALSLSFLFLNFTLGKAQAEEMALGLYPSLLEVTIKPDRSITQVYQLSNQGESDLFLTSQLVPFVPTDEKGGVLLKEEETSPAQAWISFQNADLELGQSFVLKAKEEQQLVLKIKVPEQAPEDDYYLTLLLTSQSQSDFSQNSVQPQIKIGSHLLLTVSQTGEPPRKAEITELKLSNAWLKIGHWQIIDSFVNPLFLLKVTNTGRSLFKPMGSLNITGMTGQTYRLDLLPENVLVKSSRQIQCFSPDQNQPIPCHLKTGWRTKFLLGSYQAKVSFGLDKISDDYTKTISFLAFPFYLIGGVLFLIFLTWVIKKRG